METITHWTIKKILIEKIRDEHQLYMKLKKMENLHPESLQSIQIIESTQIDDNIQIKYDLSPPDFARAVFMTQMEEDEEIKELRAELREEFITLAKKIEKMGELTDEQEELIW